MSGISVENGLKFATALERRSLEKSFIKFEFSYVSNVRTFSSKRFKQKQQD